MIKTESLLFARVQTVADAASIPVKFPNMNGPENEPTWLEVIHIPNGTPKTGWNDLQIEQGLLNVGVHCQPNEGNAVAGELVEAIKTAFVQGTVLRDDPFKVEIYYPPEVGRLIEDGQKAFYPVFIRYRSFAS